MIGEDWRRDHEVELGTQETPTKRNPGPALAQLKREDDCDWWIHFLGEPQIKG